MTAIAYSYIRFSTPEQGKGNSLERQTKAAADWCQRNDARLDTSRTYHDLGRSAFLGNHRKNPDRHALAAFLKLVEDGKIVKGSYLIIESLDRLTREHVRAGLMLLLGLIEAGIRIVQLSPSELTYDEKTDEMALMLAIVELSRGHRESKRKSDLILPVWSRKKQRARGEGHITTCRLPAWVKIEGEKGCRRCQGRGKETERRKVCQACQVKLVLIPAAAATVKRIFELAASGYGSMRLIRQLISEGHKPFGKTANWCRAYISYLLKDRRVIGEYQPTFGKTRKPDGDPIKDYFPAVITEPMFHRVKAASKERLQKRGRIGKTVLNIFAGLTFNARFGEQTCPKCSGGGTVDGKKCQGCWGRKLVRDSYYMMTRNEEGQQHQVLITHRCQEGLSPCYSFPYGPFERAILAMLREIQPSEIVETGDNPDELDELEQEQATVQEARTDLKARQLARYSPSNAETLTALDQRYLELTARIEDMKAQQSQPADLAWAEARSLVDELDEAADPEPLRLRLRSAIRRVVDSIWLLVTSKGKERFAVVQVRFVNSPDTHRLYFIRYKPARYGFDGHQPGRLWVWSEPQRDDEPDVNVDMRTKEGSAYRLKALELGLEDLSFFVEGEQAGRWKPNKQGIVRAKGMYSCPIAKGGRIAGKPA